MREVKFRAWLKDAKTMARVSDISLINEELDIYDEELDLPSGDWYSFDDVILMRPTGLCDKNGKEIWEGDVVRIEHDITETQSLGSIENKDLSVWEEVVETFEIEDVVVFVNGSFDVQEWAVGIFMPYEIEVIGNIHDNPKLMEVRG